MAFLAFDFGASSGRAILTEIEDGRLVCEELHRFPNEPVSLGGTLYWDFPRLMHEVKAALRKAAKCGREITSIGIDTWGVDFGLLDRNGRLIANPVNYRDARTADMPEAAYAVMPKAELFRHTGLACLAFNTLYQLYAMLREDPHSLDRADKLLFMPDLIAYFLTGEAKTEYTIASTSQLIDPKTRAWSYDVIDAFDLPRRLFTELQESGSVRGHLTEEIMRETGLPRVPVIAAPSHDTASAVFSVPADADSFAYISSGTWSLMGTELTTPACTEAVMNASFTNEGGVCGTTRCLKNIMGLWMIQQLRADWCKEDGRDISFGKIVDLALSAEPFDAVIDVDDQAFFAPDGMQASMKAYLEATGQKAGEGRGFYAMLAYESLALKYSQVMDSLSGIAGRKFEALNIVGGGSKNALLNQMAADACGVTVYAGPDEGTAIGNALMQALAAGRITDVKQARSIVKNSFPIAEYRPQKDETYYARKKALLGRLTGMDK